MTDQDQLKNALFANPAREHVDIKFWIGHSLDLTAEAVCEEAVKMFAQMDSMEGDRAFAEAFEPREASAFLAEV